MIGRTNAGGGGGAQKYMAGSFTSVPTTYQKTFTVAGLDFEPKLLIISRARYVNVRNNPTIVDMAFKDFERNICAGVSTSLYSVYHTPFTITLSKSGDITTVTLNENFSGDEYEDAYGTYDYYFYG